MSRVLTYFITWTASVSVTSHVTFADSPITCLAFAGDGHSLVAGSQNGLCVLAWPELTARQTIRLPFPNIQTLAFSPDGLQLAAGGGTPAEEGNVVVLAWPSGELRAATNDFADTVTAVAWRDNDTLAIASHDRSVTLWNRSQGRRLATFNDHSGSVLALASLADEPLLLSAGVDQTIRVWDVQQGQLARTLRQHSGSVVALAQRPEQAGLPIVASAATDHTIRFWQPTIGRMVRYIRLDSQPLSIAWQGKSSRLAAGCVDGHVRLIESETVSVRQERSAIDGWAYAVAWHPTDATLAVAGERAQVIRVDFHAESEQRENLR